MDPKCYQERFLMFDLTFPRSLNWVDVACSTRLGGVGFGAVLWGSRRRVVVTASMFMLTQVDVLAAEAIAFLHGLKSGRFRCWNFSIESDL
ncbi:unnamed protein product [Citrullus colocynthis]|uniref:RNase H type-1 domain-containing protein n=1 Tax=Citrullus colocynthis TaxID=252529 RepID=A0ABP0YSN7_9ROSI